MLSVKNLCKNFGDYIAVDNVSFDLADGEALAIIGSSGSGKTTILRLLNQLETLDSGKIIGGPCGLVFQDFNLFPQYTVLGNLTLAPRLLKKPYDQAESILDQVGLLEKRHNYPSQLSGGQRQRVAIARALMLQPAVLCFDEPTSALDPSTTGEIVKVIQALKGRQTMIIVTHNMDVCSSLADRVAIMEKGRLRWRQKA
ncbi:MAG: ATP-binding cassette domain-containing protein [Peptococcaceae bacterium]|nr:ATP-binding cassette domain-containing protein [Peptococcaceae bacterium]